MHEPRLLPVVMAVIALGCHAGEPPPRVALNDNTVPAGVYKDSVLTLAIEAREGRWFPDSSDGPSLDLAMFGEPGHAPQNPGPLIRVPSGATIRVSVHNALRDSTLVMYGLNTRPGTQADTIQVAAGATREVSFKAGSPGTYFYWGSTTHQDIGDRSGYDSQLHGALIVDSAVRSPPPDRVFVLGGWTGVPRRGGFAAELRVINGRSWPHTERLTYTVGDTVRMRWVDPTDSPHPMHLHGFFFDVTSRGTWAADTQFARSEQPHVVTEMPLAGGTFAMTWVPTEPGNWLLHCHVAFHTSFYLAAKPVDDPEDPVALDPMHNMAFGMRGMVLALAVKPGASLARRPAVDSGARAIRLVAQTAPKRWRGALDEMAFVEHAGRQAPAADSVPMPSSPLVLRRGQPVRITVVNHTRAPTGVHWHGIEVPAFSDGVAGFSGSENKLAPMIAPGDSFVAAFTPTRSGTFMYHAHSNESFQVSLGLYGSLLVVDSATYDPARERVIVIGGDGPEQKPGRINGKLAPDTMHLKVGQTYRMRLIEIFPDWTVRVSLTRGDTVVQWVPLAKDGAELPARAQTAQPATFISGPGQTMDFAYRPTTPGMLVFRVKHRVNSWKTELPIRVDP